MVKNFSEIFDRKLQEIKPSSEEEDKIKDFVTGFKKKLDKNLKKYEAKAVLGGSFSKGTTIKKDKYDVDIFAVFPKRVLNKDKNISSLLEKALKGTGLKAKKLPGSREYFSSKVNAKGSEFGIELVPVIEIKNSNEALNVTDVSVLHVRYIKEKIAKNKKLSDEIRLAKAFCYALGCYGAESHIKGFSGYCLEVLTAHYGKFIKLLEAASKWGSQEILDPAKHYKNKKEILEEINEAKLSSPLVTIDPVQKNRNIAAALSSEKFEIFKKASKAFLSKPSERFFEKSKFDEERIISESKRGKKSLYAVRAFSDKIKEDISGSKLLKLHNLLKLEFKKRGYEVRDYWNFSDKKASSYFKIYGTPKKILHKGPPTNMKENVSAFKKKWKKTFFKEGNIFAEITPPSPEEILSPDKKILREMGINSYRFEKLA